MHAIDVLRLAAEEKVEELRRELQVRLAEAGTLADGKAVEAAAAVEHAAVAVAEAREWEGRAAAAATLADARAIEVVPVIHTLNSRTLAPGASRLWLWPKRESGRRG